MKISVTDLSSYIYCARKLYLAKVKKIREPPKEAMVRGTVRHRAYDKINQKEEEIVVSFSEEKSFEELKKEYEDAYSEILKDVIRTNKKMLDRFRLRSEILFEEVWPYFAAEADLRAGKLHALMREKQVFGEELWKNVVPKIKSEYKVFSEELMLTGIVDQLHIYPDRCIPFELKTGKMPEEGMWDSHRIQIAAYLVLLEELFQHDFKEGVVKYLDHAEERSIAMNPFLRDEVKETVAKVKDILLGDEIPGLPENKNKCESCGIKHECLGFE